MHFAGLSVEGPFIAAAIKVVICTTFVDRVGYTTSTTLL